MNLVQAKKAITCIILSVAVIFVSLWAIFLINSYESFKKDVNGYMIVDVVEVERTTGKGE